MEEPKTLSYDWQYGREELFLRVDSYMSDDNLYIGLYHGAPDGLRRLQWISGVQRQAVGVKGEE